MSRWANAPNEAAANLHGTHPITFVLLDLDAAEIRAHDQAGRFTWGGNTWLGLGKVGELESIEEDLENPFPEVHLTLSGNESQFLTEFITTHFQGRPLSIWRGYLDVSTLQLVADPELQWPGVISHAAWGENEPGEATIQVTGMLSYEYAPSTARWTDVHQRARHAGDKFFDLLHRIAKWTAAVGSANVNHGTNVGQPRPPSGPRGGGGGRVDIP